MPELPEVETMKLQLGKFLKNPLVIFISLLRLLAAFYILANPIWGLIWSWIFDIFDAPVFLHIVKMSVSIYESIDKNMDWVVYISMFLLGVMNGDFIIFFIFLLVKLVGHILFLKTRNVKYFVLFPNFLEAVFIWKIIFPLLNIQTSTYSVVFVFVLCLLREVYLHIFFWNYVKKNGFPKIYQLIGIKREVNW